MIRQERDIKYKRKGQNNKERDKNMLLSLFYNSLNWIISARCN